MVTAYRLLHSPSFQLITEDNIVDSIFRKVLLIIPTNSLAMQVNIYYLLSSYLITNS